MIPVLIAIGVALAALVLGWLVAVTARRLRRRRHQQTEDRRLTTLQNDRSDQLSAPDAAVRAAGVIRDAERSLNEARQQAGAIVAEAEQKAGVIVAEAEEKAAEIAAQIRNDAKQEASATLKEAEETARGIVADAELAREELSTLLRNLLRDVRRGVGDGAANSPLPEETGTTPTVRAHGTE